MEQPGDGVLDELNKRLVAESLIEKSRSGRVTAYPEVTRFSSGSVPANAHLPQPPPPHPLTHSPLLPARPLGPLAPRPLFS